MKKINIILASILIFELIFISYALSLKKEEQIIQVAQAPEKQKQEEPLIIEPPVIDIDLSDQRLHLFENSKIVKTFIISSGTAKTPTPKGEFKIYEKKKLHWTGTEKYQQYLPYSLRFYGAYLIHEVPYNKAGVRDGLDKLGQPASHGCIRLNIGDAEQVFNWAKIGTKVVIHN